MEEQEDAQYCFQYGNSSCKRISISTPIYVTLYIFFSVISAVTVFLNLLVIISVSYSKHLQTPTNLLILSLAVSDLLVGLILIPATTVAIIEPCWVLGEYFCVLFLSAVFLCTSLSLGNLILISIDHYVAVCDPLMYHSKITTSRIKCCIAITWCCCIIYNVILMKVLVNVQVSSGCFEECYFSEGFIPGIIMDLVISLVVPCSIIINTLFENICGGQITGQTGFFKGEVTGVLNIQAKRSERKATKTLAMNLICWIPMYFLQLIYYASNDSSSAFICFLLYMNSLVNPIINALFYPWFKVTAKHILTVKFRCS